MDWVIALDYLQPSQFSYLVLYVGLCISKPDVISLLEQDEEPFVMKREITRGLCPGKCRLPRAGGNGLKMLFSILLVGKHLSKSLPN